MSIQELCDKQPIEFLGAVLEWIVGSNEILIS